MADENTGIFVMIISAGAFEVCSIIHIDIFRVEFHHIKIGCPRMVIPISGGGEDLGFFGWFLDNNF